jgi:hypothetical protein
VLLSAVSEAITLWRMAIGFAMRLAASAIRIDRHRSFGKAENVF